MLGLQVGVDPIPRRCKHGGLFEQVRLEQLEPNENGDQLDLVASERVHHHLAEKRRLARRRPA
eukprot:5133371-Prymnesium_polylepis.1